MKMKYGFLIIMMALLLVSFNVPTAQAFGIAKIVVKVMDESGTPLNNAYLNIRFSSNSGTIKGYTDEQGVFEAKAMSNDGVILGDITKDGYYESGIAHSFFRNTFGMWQPWGKELTVVMRPIVNPVPMYVRNASFKFPAFDQEIGFDLEKADWVIPHGQGVKSDFIFKPTQKYKDAANFEGDVTLTFSNPLDGIQVIKDDGGGDFNVGSRLRLPRIAPENGYLQKIERRIAWSNFGRQSNMEEDNNYIFRVRSEVDQNGKLKRAMYGKIRGELRYFVRSASEGKIGLYYYLNPDYTPNLEFDPKHNLFVITDPGENVRAP